MSLFHITRVSGNKKTGPIAVTTTSRDSCPSNCPLIGAGCYADLGPLGLHWDKVSNGERGLDKEQFFNEIKAIPRGMLWRHNQAGDLLANKRGMIDGDFLSGLIKANKGKKGFTYTHHKLTAGNIEKLKDANNGGFAINISANNKVEAVKHFKKLGGIDGLPVVTVLPIDAPNIEVVEGIKVVACPAEKSDKINCANCGLCAVSNRDYVIGFRAHGTRKKAANLIASA